MSHQSNGLLVRLPDSVTSKITSAANIISLNEVVIGLLKNALDSGSESVEIQVTPSRGSCAVNDSGLGIHPADFREDGGLGQRYFTSKLDKQGSVHGSNGTFLASVASLSFLSITSRHHQHQSTNSITFHRSQLLSRSTPVLDNLLTSHGTRATVRDLFGGIPVRLKQRAIAQQNANERVHEWAELRRSVVALLAAWHSPVKINLTDFDLDRKVTILSVESSFVALKPSIEHLLYHSELLKGNFQQIWIPASASARSIKVRGVIGLQPWSTKRLQFIDLGIMPLPSNTTFASLYDEINQIFQRSNFGFEGDSNPTIPATISRSTLKKEPHLARKAIDKWPMFHLQITLDYRNTSALDLNHMGTQAWEKLLQVFQALIEEWLKAQHFKVRKRKSNRYKQVEKAQKQVSSNRSANTRGRNALDHDLLSMRPASIEDFDSPGYSTMATHLKSTVLPYEMKEPQSVHTEHSIHGSRLVLGNDEHGLTADQYPSSVDDRANKDTSSHDSTLDDEIMEWMDPHSGQRIQINARTGIAIRPSSATTTSRPSTRLTIRPGSARTAIEESPWLNNVLNNWKNPVFTNTEAAIPSIFLEEISHPSKCCGNKLIHQFPQQSPLESCNLTVQNLKEARFIAQVNNQFLLIMVKDDSSSDEEQVLVAVDQHAADERCKLEAYLEELVSRDSAELTTSADIIASSQLSSELAPNPMVFEISQAEAEELQRVQQQFAEWKITYTIGKADLKAWRDNMASITFNTLPSLIIDRCIQEPRLVISMIRSHLVKLVEQNHIQASDRTSSVEHENHPWLRKIGRCPSALLDLLHSKACRNAIMFNNVLTQEESQELLRSLSRCAFPFQCAHGRPSMVPLVRLTRSISSLELIEESSAMGSGDEFLDAFQKWHGPLLSM